VRGIEKVSDAAAVRGSVGVSDAKGRRKMFLRLSSERE
jgi:hypothetical protein